MTNPPPASKPRPYRRSPFFWLMGRTLGNGARVCGEVTAGSIRLYGTRPAPRSRKRGVQ